MIHGDWKRTRRQAMSTLVALTSVILLSPDAASAGEQQERILVFGDSQAQGLVGGLQRAYRDDHDCRVLDRSKPASGLAAPTPYDWQTQAHNLADTEHASVAFALFGVNDRPPVRIEGKIDPDLLRTFTEAYAARVTAIAQSFHAAGIPLVWIGQPIVQDATYAEDMAILNAIYLSRSVASGGSYVSMWDAFKGSDGAFTPTGDGLDGQIIRLRASDGVHMTNAGYDVMAAMLVQIVEQYRNGSIVVPLSAALRQ